MLGEKMKVFLMVFVMVLISGCDVSKKNDELSDDETPDNSDVDSTADEDETNDEAADEDFIKLTSLTRFKVSAPFPEMNNFTVNQGAVITFSDYSVKRNFNHVDTSFDMSGEDIVKIREIIYELVENKDCMDCTENENFLEIVFDDDAICRICDDKSLVEIDYYLLIPVRTMLWPFEPQDAPHPVGHHSVSFQNYTEEEGNYEGAYFHHGIDIIMPDVAEVYNQVSGRVTKIDHYRTELVGEHPLYFEVVVETVNGLIFEYHHIDKNTVPKNIYEALESGELIPEGELLGKIVFWPMPDVFSEKLFHHIHLNIMNQDKIKINPALLMLPQIDTTKPVIEEIFITDSSRTKTLSDEPDEPFHVVIKVHDFTDIDPWPNPVRFSEVFISDEDENIVFHHAGYDFIAMMDIDEKVFVCDYYLCLIGNQSYSSGDYFKREFFVVVTSFDLEGNVAEPIDPLLFDPGKYTLSVKSCDESGNCTLKSETLSFSMI